MRQSFRETALAVRRNYDAGLMPEWWGKGNAGRRRIRQWSMFLGGIGVTDKMGRTVFFKKINKSDNKEVSTCQQ